jgi:hypothetical protein
VQLGGIKGMKRTEVTVTLFFLSLFISLASGSFVVDVAKANPFIIFKTADPIPGTVPPIINVSCPKNNTVYPSNVVCLSFNVSKPQPPTSLEAGINSVRYTLDGHLTGFYYYTHYNSHSPPGLPIFNHSENLTLSNGKHTLVVNVSGVVLPGNMTIFGMHSSETIVFTVSTAISSETTIPEFPSWAILPIIMLSTLVAVFVKRRVPWVRKSRL